MTTAADAPTEALAGITSAFDRGAVVAADLEKATLCFLDWCAVAFAGAGEATTRIVRETVLADGGHAQAVLIGTRQRGTATQAALINGTASHVHDYDDGHRKIPGQPTVPVGSAVWAAAEREGASGETTLLALAAGIEAMARLGQSIAPAHYESGWHASATLGAIGAAVGCARLMRLPHAQAVSAIGLAACRAAGLKAVFGSMAKSLQLGHAAAVGLQAVDLARRGFDCQPEILAGPKGFLVLHDGAFDPRPLVAPVAAPFEIHGVTFKRHASCFMTHAPIEAALAFRRQYRGPLSRLRAVTMKTNHDVLTVCGRVLPTSGLDMKFSAPFTVALALAGRETGALATYRAETAADPELRSLAEKVILQATAGIDIGSVAAVFELVDGPSISIDAQAVKVSGTLEDLREGVIAKASGLLAPVIGVTEADRVIDAILALETAPHLPDLALFVRGAAVK
jgi:2-methylcitrate dehydratase PrpD